MISLRNRFPEFLVRFASVCLFTAAFLATGVAFAQPWAGSLTPIADVFRYKDDTVVVIRGEVVRQLKEDEFVVRDNSGEVVVDVQKKKHFGVGVGQTITVRGVVDIGLFRAKVVKASDVQIEKTADTTSADPTKRADLRSIRLAYLASKDGDIVTVAGRIVRRLDQREFIIRDRTGEILVDALFGKFHNVPLTVGQDIIVTGEVDIYWGGPWREIEAHNIQVQKEISEPAPPAQLEVIPISQIRENSSNDDVVVIQGSIIRQVDSNDFLFQDDTGDIIVKVDPRLFSHHGLTAGRTYTVTGRVKKGPFDEIKVVALIITALQVTEEKAPPTEEGPPEIPIASVYYESLDGDVVTVAGSVIRPIGDGDFIMQDDTGSIVIDVEQAEHKALELSPGKFVIVTGRVNAKPEVGNEIVAQRILARKRVGE